MSGFSQRMKGLENYKKLTIFILESWEQSFAYTRRFLHNYTTKVFVAYGHWTLVHMGPDTRGAWIRSFWHFVGRTDGRTVLTGPLHVWTFLPGSTESPCIRIRTGAVLRTAEEVFYGWPPRHLLRPQKSSQIERRRKSLPSRSFVQVVDITDKCIFGMYKDQH